MCEDKIERNEMMLKSEEVGGCPGCEGNLELLDVNDEYGFDTFGSETLMRCNECGKAFLIYRTFELIDESMERCEDYDREEE